MTTSDSSRLRVWWWHHQALDGRLLGQPPGEILAQTGWARSVGGAAPYLTLFSRGRLSREGVDTAVATLDIYELPSARGCTYVVPAEDFALALMVGQPFHEPVMRTARSLGVTDQEIDQLCQAVMDALDHKTMGPAELRDATGAAGRSLGDKGKKKGLSTTLPVALGRLQAHGEIRRVPTNGRLDQQHYVYARWRPNPLEGSRLFPEEANTKLARRFFQWAAPATLAEFRWFSGLGVGASKIAAAPLNLVPLHEETERLLFPEQKEAVYTLPIPTNPRYELVSSLDALFLLRRDILSFLDEDDLTRPVLVGKTFREVGGLTDLPNHAILDRGRLVGLWEYDVNTNSIAWLTFQPPDEALELAVARTETFIESELGDARSFSLDSPKSRAPRIDALRRGTP